MGPIDYSTDVAQPFASALQGMQSGLAIRQVVDQQDQQEQARLAAQQMNADLTAASRDHTLLPQMMVRYPQLAEKLKIGWDTKSADAQSATLREATDIYAALQSGHAEVAAQLLNTRAQALRNSGNAAEADATEAMAEKAKADPQGIAFRMAGRISALPGGDKVIESVAKLGAERRADALAPDQQRRGAADADRARSEAQTAAVAAKFAESNAALDLQKKGWDITKIQEDIKVAKLNSQIAAGQLAVAREGNTLKRDEMALKVKELQDKRDERVRERVASAENGASAIDNMLNTIERVKKAPGLDNVLGSIQGRMPSFFSDDNVDAEMLVETLGSQAFLAQLPAIKGTGNLSNAEGDKLQSALQNLGRKQSEKQFRENLDEAARLLNKARAGLAKSTGIPLDRPDTPAAPGARPPLASFER